MVVANLNTAVKNVPNNDGQDGLLCAVPTVKLHDLSPIPGTYLVADNQLMQAIL